MDIQPSPPAVVTRGDPIVTAVGLTKEYGDGAKVTALAGVSLDVGTGEFLSIMGPSGSGKSTLLHILGALDRPTSGHVTVNGKDLSGFSDKQMSLLRRHEVGFVFQFFSLVPVLDAEENVALPAVISGMGKSEFSAQVDALIELVGLVDRRGHLPSELSGGEQQRVAVARALVLEPSVLLADEPTGNLDTRTGSGILQLLKRLQVERGQTILMVTHDPRAAAWGDRVLYLEDGKLADTLVLEASIGYDSRVQAVLSWLQAAET